MTLAVFHDFPGLENGLTKFHDFSGRVVTLNVWFKLPQPLLPDDRGHRCEADWNSGGMQRPIQNAWLGARSGVH